MLKELRKILVLLGFEVFLEKRRLKRFRKTDPYKKMYTFYGQFIRKGDKVFDIGANVGERTVVFMDLGANVVCFEPQSFCRNRLLAAFKGNTTVKIVEYALGESAGESEIAICEDANVISSMSERFRNESRFSKDYKWTKTEKIKVITFDDAISTYGNPDFAKIDVEGFEKNVMMGLHKTVKHLSFEFRDEFFDEAESCMNSLETQTSYSYNYSVGEEMDFVNSTWLPKDQFITYIKTHFSGDLWGDIYAKPHN
jgi:FkbM family methyltransferase